MNAGGRLSTRALERDAWRLLMRDSGAERAIDPERIFGPNIGYRSQGRHWRRDLGRNRPPPIGVGEIRTTAGQDVGALELVTRFAEMRRRNPGATLPLGGLVTTTPGGLVRYVVADPNRDRIVWQGNLARLPWINRVPPAARERAIRSLLRRITGQTFQNLPYPHAGADLVPAVPPATPFDEADEADLLDAMEAWA